MRRFAIGASLAKFWARDVAGRDPNERFFRLLIGADARTFVFPSDLVLFVTAIVETHPSLQFLKDEHLFQEKFIDFIVTRAFYVMDTDLRGTASIQQIKRVDLASIFYNAEQIQDVNDDMHHIFNYQHFYVTFCKFWDLDADSDGFISKDDMLKFNESAVSPVIIERFFRSNFFPRASAKKPMIDLRAFSYFLISTEDKTSPTAINFWFKLCDLDDDGVLSIKEIELLYEVQFERMRITGNETIPFSDICRQLMDMVRPDNLGRVTLKDLLRSKMTDMFFNILFDLQKFLVKEYQSPLVNTGFDEATKSMSPWEIFVLIEYDQLVSDAA
jgi:serine/threonine-protein phosphatase 2A regulatory subunit B''